MNTWESLRRFRWRELAKGERERERDDDLSGVGRGVAARLA